MELNTMNPQDPLQFKVIGNEVRIPVSLICSKEQLLSAFDARFEENRTDSTLYGIPNDLMMEWGFTDHYSLLYINGLSDHCEAVVALVNQFWVEEADAQAKAKADADLSREQLLAHLRSYDVNWLARLMQNNDKNGSWVDCLDEQSPEYGGVEVLLGAIADFAIEYGQEEGSSVDAVLESLHIPTMASVQEALDADVEAFDAMDPEQRASAGYPSTVSPDFRG